MTSHTEIIQNAKRFVELFSTQGEDAASEYLKGLDVEVASKVIYVIKKSMAEQKAKTQNMSNACYNCVYRENLPGDTHSSCSYRSAIAIGDAYGTEKGWFFHPYNFDPTWLRYCDSYKTKN